MSTCRTGAATRSTLAAGPDWSTRWHATPAGQAGDVPDAANVIVKVHVVFCLDRFGHCRQQPVAQHIDHAGSRRRMERRGIGQLVGMRRTIRGVQIDNDMRVIMGHHQLEGARFGCVELHKVPIEIEVLPVRPLPLAADRTVLR